MKKLQISYGEQYLAWLLGAGDGSHPTNPVRAKLATEKLEQRLGVGVEILDPMPAGERDFWVDAVKSVHDADYVDRVLAGHSSEWFGVKPEMGETALAMFAGTGRLVQRVLRGEASVVFNPQGAKHHAQRNFGSGFCVFNDMAWAAIQFKKAGMRPLYLDWDIHAGDGVFHMLLGEGIPTISIHRSDIYPNDERMNSGAVARDIVDESVASYNYNVPGGATDDDFIAAIDKAGAVIDANRPDVILLAAGADGYTGRGALGQLANYTEHGFKYAANMVVEMAVKHAQGRVVIGGAGGYQPLDHTPEVWAAVVETIANAIATNQISKLKEAS